MFGKLKAKLKEKLSIFSRKTQEVAEEKVTETPIEDKKPSADDLIEETIKEDSTEEKHDEGLVEGVPLEKVEEEVVDRSSDNKEDIVETDETIKDESGEDIKEEEILTTESKEEVTEELLDELKEKETPKQEEAAHEVDEKSEEGLVVDNELSDVGLVTEKYEENKVSEKIKERKVPDEPSDIGLITQSAEEPTKIEEKLATAQDLIQETKNKFEKEDLEKKTDYVEEKIEGKPKKSFFGKLKQAFTTKTISADKFEDLFWELEVLLLESNVSVEVIEKIKEDLKEELVDKPLPRNVEAKIEETLKVTLSEILDFDKIDLLSKVKNKSPYVIAFFGINGAGKTTSIAKLTKYFQNHGKSVVLAACDTFRAAAIQQLEEHANKLSVKIIKHDYGSDAAAVAYDAVKHAVKEKIDVVLIDTAGRLHSNTNLMAELEKLIRVSKPDLKVFVGESITGNDCIEQAVKFNELVEQDGVILTKADIDEKGGAPLSISYVIKKPILFLGTGQNYEDFEEFDKNKILERLGF